MADTGTPSGDSRSTTARSHSSLAAKIAAARGEGKYLTTADTCSCPDHRYRNRVCKHMRAFRTLHGLTTEE